MSENTVQRPAEIGVQESIKTLEKLFPDVEYGNKGLDGSYGQAGRFAFAGPISWRERARRILALVKHLRKEGDVYVLLRPGFGKPEQFYFVAVQKGREVEHETPKHAEPEPAGNRLVRLLAPSREALLAKLPDGLLRAPKRILFEGKAYRLTDDCECPCYHREELVEASSYEIPRGPTWCPVILHDGEDEHRGLEVSLREGSDTLTYRGKTYQWRNGEIGGVRHYFAVPEARPAGQRTFRVG